jgi:hypothetical protein
MPQKKVAKTPKASFKKSNHKFRGLIVVLFIALVGSLYLLATHADSAPRVAVVSDASGQGYWVAATDGGVFSEGNAVFYGSKGGSPLSSPVVGMVATADAKGYFLVSQNGSIYPFGDAVNHGSLTQNYASDHINNIVGMALDAATGGYWLVGSDGGVYSFDAAFYGSLGGKKLSAPIVGMTATDNSAGYWLVGSDGGVFTFGNAPFLGSLGGVKLAKPISAIGREAGTNDYWLVGQDGGVFTFGSGFYGSLSGTVLDGAISGISSTANGKGYWLVGQDGGIFSFGDAVFHGTPPQVPVACPYGYTGNEPTCVKEVCPTGYIGTWPSCTKPAPPPAPVTTGKGPTGTPSQKGEGGGSGVPQPSSIAGQTLTLSAPVCAGVVTSCNQLQQTLSSLKSQQTACYNEAADDNGNVRLAEGCSTYNSQISNAQATLSANEITKVTCSGTCTENYVKEFDSEVSEFGTQNSPDANHLLLVNLTDTASARGDILNWD